MHAYRVGTGDHPISNATLECACGKSIYGRGFNMNFVRPPLLSGKGRLGEIRIQA